VDQHNGLEGLAREWERRGLKRRDFLRLTGTGVSIAAIGGILAACGGDPTATVAPSAAPASAAPSAAASTAASAAPSAAPSAAASTAASAAPSAAASTAASAAPSSSPAGRGGNFAYPSGGKYSTIEPVRTKGGTAIEVGFADAKTNNPILSNDNVSTLRTGIQFNPLIGINPDTALPYGDLATEVPTRENGGISQDGLTYTFKLRNDVKWHDGTQFTAKDVVFTYKVMLDPASTSPRTAQLTERIESVSNPDDYTVVFKLKKIVAPFLVSDCIYGIIPQHILGNVPVADIKSHPFSLGDPKASIGTGPFKMQEWKKDDTATLVKNPTYFRGEPALDRYVFRVVKDSTAVVASLKTNESDWGAVSSTFYEEMKKQQNLNTVVYDTYSFEFSGFQLDQSKTTIFQDKKVRQALTYALDRDAMVQAVYNGLGVTAKGTMPTLSFAYQPDKMKINYTYDTKKAEQLLDEAGWVKGPDGIRAKDGKKLQFTLWVNAGNKNREALVTVMQQQWKAIGVDATPKTEEWNAYLTRITETRDFEMFMVGFGWTVDPDQSSMWNSKNLPPGGFNIMSYKNPEVDRLLESALTELDVEKRKQLYVDMQNILLDEMPAIILVFPQAVGSVNKRLHNCYPNAVAIRWNIHTWWVDDGK
jgi:peptide/nickel transport system substrate-binding protein